MVICYYCGELSYCLRCKLVLKPARSVVAIQAVVNRELKDSLPSPTKSYLNESFQYTKLEGCIAISALVAHSSLNLKNGFAFRGTSAKSSIFALG